MKFIPIKFIWLFLLPLVFCNSVCNNGLEANQRNVHIRIDGDSGSTSTCDFISVGKKKVRLIVQVQLYDPVTGQYRPVDQRDITTTNTWNDGFFFDFTLDRDKSYRIFTQAVQDCSACCGIASGTCTEPPAFLKTALLLFYAEITIPEDGGSFVLRPSLYNCDCRGC